MKLRTDTKVLVVDDSKDSLFALKTTIESLGIQVLMAQSGEQALREALQHRLAAIILDVRMPGLDGFSVAKLVRQRPKYEKTPIIFLTALSEQKDIVKGYNLGAVDYLIKPIVPEILRAKVTIFCELFEKTMALEHHAGLLEKEVVVLRGFSSVVVSERNNVFEFVHWYVSCLKKFLLDRDSCLAADIAHECFLRKLSGKQLVEIHLEALNTLAERLGELAYQELVHDARLLLIAVMAHMVDLLGAHKRLDDISSLGAVKQNKEVI